MTRVVVSLLIAFFLVSLPLSSVGAAKPRVRKAAVRRTAGVSYVTVRKSKPSHSLKVIFSNLGSVSKVTYEVQYTSVGRSQGIVGSFSPTGQTSDTRDVYLGTCSSGVCTPHASPTKITVVVRVTLKSGGVYTKISRASVF